MKLDNKGFGMREFIIYSCILILILLFVAYSINNLYKGIEDSRNKEDNKQTQKIVVPEEKKPVVKEEEKPKPKPVDYSYYHNLESKFKDASLLYMKNYPTQIDEGAIFTIKLDDLVGLNYLDSFKNKNTGESCVGYSNVYIKNGEDKYSVDSFINCGEYKTEGYR